MKHQYCPAEYPHLRHKVYGQPGGAFRCPGSRIPDESRLNPVATRRRVLAALRACSTSLHGGISRWDVTGLMFDEAGHEVPRPVEHFPENSPEAWSALDLRLGRIIADLTHLQRLAMNRAEHGFTARALADES